MSLQSLKHVHILGIGGTLMAPFAVYLKSQGVLVTGSDLPVYPPMSDVLGNAGIKPFTSYDEKNLDALPGKPDLVIIGNVIQRVNPEAKAVLDRGWSYTSLPECLEKWILPATKNIIISGTHGKTTTSSLMTQVFRKLGKNPSYFIGGVPKDFATSFEIQPQSSGKPFILEGDEYDTAFWDKVPKFFHYLPDHAILTSVEFDHADIYANLDSVLKAFEGLLERIRPGGYLIACTDYENVRTVIGGNKNVRVISYGSAGNSHADYQVVNYRMENGKSHFDIVETKSGKTLASLKLQIPGHHNALNVLAVWLECREFGLDLSEVTNALAGFQGVKRRQEVRGEVRGVLVIDDFAHHPTAVVETLKALRLAYPGRKLHAVFEPRSATSRRKVFQNDYVAAFHGADEIWISKPYNQTGIEASNLFSSQELVDELNGDGVKTHHFEKVDEVVKQMASEAHSGDVFAILSNGSFDGLIPKLLKALA